ncbi:MAG TPA: zf-HC2 domain-containing protein [Bryobacteraceae bacterium]|nr:zf-HC2 domain-containing protein [Bryobacteraceae bacterium]
MHLTDQDLILSADGELDSRRAAEVRAHLDACWSCRTRQAELQQAVTDFMRSYRGQLDDRLPPHAGPRALLRAQMEQRAAMAQAPIPYRKAFGGALIAASIVALIFSASVFRMPGDLSKPKNALTPGETRAVTIDDVCRLQKPHEETRPLYVPVSLQQKVFSEYGIRDARPSAYEVDYLITPELGGADSIRNLWPEPYSIVWNARVKDELEDRLHDLVCEGKLDLATAQREISTDWIAAYKKYFHTDRPL